MTYGIIMDFIGLAFALIGIVITAAQRNFIATSWAVVALVLWLGMIVRDLA